MKFLFGMILNPANGPQFLSVGVFFLPEEMKLLFGGILFLLGKVFFLLEG